MQLELQTQRWQVVNDTVMGGKSHGEVTDCRTHLMFKGRISLANQGGFASARCHFTERLHGIEMFRLGIRGDGRTYQFRLRANDESGTVAWRSMFTTDGRQQLVDLPIPAFEAAVRGRQVQNAGIFRPEEMNWVGFLLADRQPGPFSLEVHSVEAL